MSGCTSDDTPSADVFAMEAWIDSDGYPVVLLTKALAPTTSPVDVKDIMVRWAKVTISDGTKTVVMTGGMDKSVFPPFSYRTFAMQGEVGKTYTIRAEYEGTYCEATATILQPAEITSVSFEHVTDSTFSGTLKFRAPDTRDTCRYIVMTRVRNDQTRHYPAFMGAVSSFSPNEECQVPLTRGKHIDSPEKFSPNFKLGDSIDIILSRIQPDVYSFWDAYQNEVYFGNKVFISTTSTLKGNVHGGYGIFSARGSSRKMVILSD